MKLLYLLTLSFFIVSCNKKDRVSLDFSFNSKNFESGELKALINNVPNDYKRFTKYITTDPKAQLVSFFLNDSTALYFNIENNEEREIALPFPFNIEEDDILFSEDKITIFHENNLYSYDIETKALTTINENILAEDEFLSRPLYTSSLINNKDVYYLRIGKSLPPNFIGDKHKGKYQK